MAANLSTPVKIVLATAGTAYKICERSPARGFLLLQSQKGGDVTVAPNVAPVDGVGMLIAAGGSYEYVKAPSNEMWATATEDASELLVQEGTD